MAFKIYVPIYTPTYMYVSVHTHTDMYIYVSCKIYKLYADVYVYTHN